MNKKKEEISSIFTFVSVFGEIFQKYNESSAEVAYSK